MFKYYNHLGFENPYYFKTENQFIIRKSFSEVYNIFPLEKDLDITAIIEILNKNYILGDRSIISGIEKTPWMAQPNMDLDLWQFAEIPNHKEYKISEEEIAIELFKRISSEMLGYIGNVANVGILLSGGMDSRIVAGTLDNLIKTNELININVTALTWGNENSRDVQYSKEIARRLGWKWKHYFVSANDLLKNIEETARHGCEYSPIHLHALPQIRDDEELALDIILAGSYGDSIGRAEYSSKKVKNIRSIASGFKNIGGLLRDDVYKKFSSEYLKDIKKYHLIFPQNKVYQQYEQDYQLHYMRRMLNPCINILSNKAKVHQVFTHPEVFGYMWSIDPELRNDNIYKYILSFFKTDLSDIPWSRTGLPYGQQNGRPDELDKKHHSYQHYITNDLYYNVERLVLSNEIKNTGLFNMSSIKTNLKLVKHIPHLSHYYEEKLLWIASLAEFIKVYKVNSRHHGKGNLADMTNSLFNASLQFLTKSIKEYIVKIR